MDAAEKSDQPSKEDIIAGLSRSTHFAFDHKVFSIEDAYFAAPEGPEKPMYFMTMGESKASVALSSLIKEFDIETGSDDFELLELVAKSLQFVKRIRPNDLIPKEILDGSASWSVEPHHLLAASGRVTYQLVSWMLGKEEVITDLNEIQKLIEDPEVQEKLPDAAKFAAEKLGLGPDQKQAILTKTENLANEMSYIEALKEHYQKIKDIEIKVDQFLTLSSSEATVKEDLLRIKDLLKTPIEEYGNLLTACDAQTCEILNVLKHFDDQVENIRRTRDKLHFAFLEWKEMCGHWEGAETLLDENATKLIRETYRFLAQNFAQSTRW